MENKKWTLKEIRDALDMTQKEMGEALGVADTCISRWENNIHRPLKVFQSKIDELELRAKAIMGVEI